MGFKNAALSSLILQHVIEKHKNLENAKLVHAHCSSPTLDYQLARSVIIFYITAII